MMRRRVWTQQPPGGTPINWNNPICRGMQAVITFNRGMPYDEVYGVIGSLRGNGKVVGTDKGMAYEGGLDNNDAAEFPKNDNRYTGYSQCSAFALAKNRKTAIAATGAEFVFGHRGTGDDPWAIDWDQGEDLGFSIDNTDDSSGNPIQDVIVDGLHVTAGAHPQTWNAVGGTWDGTTVTARVNRTKGAGTSCSGTMATESTSNNILRVGNTESTSASWDGWVAIAVLWDRALSDAEWNSMSDNPWQIFKKRISRFAITDVPSDTRVALKQPRRVWTQQVARCNSSSDELSKSSNLPPSGSFTITGWFKRMSAQAFSYRGMISYDNASVSSFLGFNDSNQFIFSAGSTGVFTLEPTVGDWFFLAQTVAGSGANQGIGYLFSKGGFLESQTVTGPNSAINQIYWGTDGWTEWTDAQIADGGVWNRPLTSSEIRRVWEAGPLAVPLGLVNHYPFDGNFRDSRTGEPIDVTTSITFEAGISLSRPSPKTIIAPANEALPDLARVDIPRTKPPL